MVILGPGRSVPHETRTLGARHIDSDFAPFRGHFLHFRSEEYEMNGKGQAIVAAVMLAMLGWIVTEQRLVRGDITDLRERMARLEGQVDTLVEIFTDRQAAK